MTFTPVIHPLLLIPLVLGVLALAVYALVRSRGARSRGVWAARIMFVLACFAVLLRPGVPGGQAETYATDADVFIVLDTTSSIVAEDWGDGQPRLEGVREDVEGIVEEYPGARFSLITFDAATSVRLPLTTDTAALDSAMSVLSPEVTEQSAGSTITQAQTVLHDVLRGAADSGQDRSRIVFYLGDGEQTSPASPGSFADSAPYVDAGRVLGYGTAEGGPMRITSAAPGAGGEDYIEYQGQPARSVIDEGNLREIANQLGIEYEHREDGAEPELPEAPPVTAQNSAGAVGNVIELYWIPAVIAGALLAFEVCRATAAAVRLRELTPARRSGGDGS